MNDDIVSETLKRLHKVDLRVPEKDEDYSIDFQYWLKFDVWKLKQAASILENSNPDKLVMRLINDESFEKRFNDTLRVILSATGGSLTVEAANEKHGEEAVKYRNVKPADIVQWAAEKGFDIPEPIIHLSDKKVAADTARSRNADATDLEHAPSLLKLAIESWRRIWEEGDIHDNPKQKIIVPWIEDTFKTSNREAKLIDQIIRPDKKKKGAVKTP